MAITTRLQPKYSLKMIVVAVVSIGLGIWGILDYAVIIPGQARAVHRRDICQQVLDAMKADPASDQYRSDIRAASETVGGELQSLITAGRSADEAPPTPEEVRAALENVQSGAEGDWFKLLLLFQGGLADASRRTSAERPATDLFVLAAETAQGAVNSTAGVTPPGKWDKLVKGLLFVPCLPFGLYLFWPLLKKRREIYTLEDDGSLRLPSGATWSEADIADIDMGTWMSKSIAHVVHQNGDRVKMDDYIHQNTHLIVGALASKRYPNEWTSEASPVKADTPETEADAENAGSASTDETAA